MATQCFGNGFSFLLWFMEFALSTVIDGGLCRCLGVEFLGISKVDVQVENDIVYLYFVHSSVDF